MGGAVVTYAEEFARDWAAGVSCIDMGLARGMSGMAISKQRHRLNLPPRINAISTLPPTPENLARIVDLVACGLSDSLIAEELGVTKCVISGLRKRNNISKSHPTLSRPRQNSESAKRGWQSRRLASGIARSVVVPIAPSAPLMHFKIRAPGMCQFPLWGNHQRPDGRLCENVAALADEPYCVAHHSVCHAAPKPMSVAA